MTTNGVYAPTDVTPGKKARLQTSALLATFPRSLNNSYLPCSNRLHLIQSDTMSHLGQNGPLLQPKLSRTLTSAWEFQEKDAGNDQWMPVASVPSVVHLDLLNNAK
jgi:hypothetical protein